jgi:hypothetical protein
MHTMAKNLTIHDTIFQEMLISAKNRVRITSDGLQFFPL